MNELKIKSKALNIVDYKSVDLTEYLPEFKSDNDKLENDIRRIQYANGKKVDADNVEKGDLALLSCRSTHPHYQKDDIYLVVGKKLYSAELEEKIVGLPKGKSQIVVEDTDVTVDIKSIVRTAVPTLTDENIKSWGIDNVTTVEELKRYCFNRQVDAFRDDSEEADMVVTILCNKVTDESAFEYDKEEFDAMTKTVNAQLQRLRDYQESDEAEESEEELEIDNLANLMVEQTLKASVIGYKMLSEKNDFITFVDYENEVVNRAELLHITADELKDQYSVLDFALEMYAQYFFDCLDDYVGKYMKEHYYKKNNKVDVYDTAIIGAGPAGLSAALTLNLHNKNIIWFGTNALSDKVEKSEKIANYVGFEPISGKDLNDKFRTQMKIAGLEIIDKMVTQISKIKNQYMVFADNEIYNAKTVLLTIGSVPAKGITNEQELLGHGVSYCATCDGFLYKDKIIAVFCGAKRYEYEVEYLAEIARKVYLYTTYKDSNLNIPNVEMLKKPVKAVLGKNKADGIELTDGTKINVDGVFFLRSSVAPATILKGLEMNGAHIVVNRDCETNIDGCFAAGDCTGRPYQIAKAVGEGNVAAHKIVEYLA